LIGVLTEISIPSRASQFRYGCFLDL